MLPQANGSARVTLVNGDTEIVAAVKVELGQPDAARPNEGTIECNVECWATGAPSLRGRPTAEVNAELSAALRRCAHAYARDVHVSRSRRRALGRLRRATPQPPRAAAAANPSPPITLRARAAGS